MHIVPDSVTDPRHLFLGLTKDIFGRTEYFNARGIPFDEIIAERRSDALLIKALQSLDLSQRTAAIFEMTLYPSSILFLRQHAPNIHILTRPANARFYQQLHYTLASILHSDRYRSPRDGLTALRVIFLQLKLDYLSTRRSDHILSISQWESKKYWRFLAGTSTVEYVPYFLPASYEQHVLPLMEKKHQCVCLMSTTAATGFLLDAARSFMRLVERLGRECPEWNFVITGDFPANAFTLPERVTPTDFLDTPFTILAESRAIALLSDYGFGFKTKVLDAIQNKCYVLVTGKLYQRLPVEVQPYCIVVNKHSVDSFKSALERCLQPYPDGNPNDVLRSQAFAALDELLLR